jgi:hypothetical protein
MFMLTIAWLLSMVVGTIKINNDKKCKEITGDFDHHVDAAIQFGEHCTMEHIQGFSRSHCMPSSGKCLRRIAPAAAMVDDFGCKHKSTTKTQLLACILQYN